MDVTYCDFFIILISLVRRMLRRPIFRKGKYTRAMDEQLYKPIWLKAVLAFALILLGILLTFIVYRFFPIPKQEGFDGMGALLYIFLGLGVCVVLYLVGVILRQNHPYRMFFISLCLFVIILVFVRWSVIG